MIYTGDCLKILPTLDAESVQCCVTSPPYYGLRDYGHDGQIGLESTPEAYVDKLVAVFREVRRVLRNDCVLWLNLGDSYAASWKSRGNGGSGPSSVKQKTSPVSYFHSELNGKCPDGIKPKDLIGIPWRVAFALQADGWWLRQDIIWSKPNPMPESVTDRCTKAHEYIFLLTKSARYFYDSEAIKEPFCDDRMGNPNGGGQYSVGSGRNDSGALKTGKWNEDGKTTGRNRRSVWTIATKPFSGAHFAVFPPEIPEICIRAGTSEKGCCPECGSPWERVVDVPSMDGRPQRSGKAKYQRKDGYGMNSAGQAYQEWRNANQNKTTGWRPTCTHNLPPIPCTVLDPFSGSGTTGVVAERLGRKYIGIELNPAYSEMGEKRIDAARLPLAEQWG